MDTVYVYTPYAVTRRQLDTNLSVFLGGSVPVCVYVYPLFTIVVV